MKTETVKVQCGLHGAGPLVVECNSIDHASEFEMLFSEYDIRSTILWGDEIQRPYIEIADYEEEFVISDEKKWTACKSYLRKKLPLFGRGGTALIRVEDEDHQWVNPKAAA